jgi:hypothetical protein
MKTAPPKRHEHCLLRWPADAKTKTGLRKGKLVGLGVQMPSWALPAHLPTKHYPSQALQYALPFAHLFFIGLISDPGRSGPDAGTLYL